jgi:hypothetical protein
VMDNATIYNYSKDPEITGAIHDSLGIPEKADPIMGLQKVLNDAKPPTKEKLDVDGLYGPLTMGRLKEVFTDAVKNKDFETVDKLMIIVEAVNNKINRPGQEGTDNELQALYDTGYAFWDKNTKGTLEMGPVEITPNK